MLSQMDTIHYSLLHLFWWLGLDTQIFQWKSHAKGMRARGGGTWYAQPRSSKKNVAPAPAAQEWRWPMGLMEGLNKWAKWGLNTDASMVETIKFFGSILYRGYAVDLTTISYLHHLASPIVNGQSDDYLFWNKWLGWMKFNAYDMWSCLHMWSNILYISKWAKCSVEYLERARTAIPRPPRNSSAFR
jgi:hypothetical protein